MKWKYLTGVVMLMLLISCAATRQAAPNSNLNGGWKLAVFPYQKKTLAEVFGTRVIELHFDNAAKTIAGTTGCNRFTGSFTATADSLVFSQHQALTKMACPDYDEQLFLNALNRVNRYRLIEGQLELLQQNEIVMIFAKIE